MIYFDLRHPLLGPSAQKSYQYWTRFLRQLSQTDILNVDRGPQNKYVNPRDQNKQDRQIWNANEKCGDFPTNQNSVSCHDKVPATNCDQSEYQWQRITKEKLPQLQFISGSDSEAETLIDLSDTPSRNDSSHSCKNNHNQHHSYQYHSGPFWHKEVVKPIVFEMDDSTSFRQFLIDFERYFDQKYTGNDIDRCQALSEFLSSPLLAAYKILGGSQKKYVEMKLELLKQYDTLKIKGTRQWRTEFYNTKMKDDETIVLYGGRLKQLAERAFPDTNMETQSELRHHFCDTVPEWFKREMKMVESIDRRTGRGKHLSWSDRMSLAREEEGKRRKLEDRSNLKSVNYGQLSMPSSVGDPTKTAAAVTTCASPTTDKPMKTEWTCSTICTFCKKPGHSIANCFAKQRQQPRKTNSGKTKCMFCGRNNHDITMCRDLRKTCVMCEGEIHKVKDCPLYTGQRPISISIKCSICVDSHLGSQCSQFIGREEN